MKLREIVTLVFGLALLGLLGWGFIWLSKTIWGQFTKLDSSLAVGILTAATTIIVATLTVVLGRYFERIKDSEAHFRTAKIQIYDDFLSELFKLFKNDGTHESETDLVAFLREWQRKMIVWGGAPVLSAYIKWKNHMARGNPDAQTFFLMDDFFKAIRQDLGLSNSGLERGIFTHLILKNSVLFLELAKKNPKITLDELTAIEKKMGI